MFRCWPDHRQRQRLGPPRPPRMPRRMLEITGHPEVPVAQGAIDPLVNTEAQTERWEALYGKLVWKGVWMRQLGRGQLPGRPRLPRPGGGARSEAGQSQRGQGQRRAGGAVPGAHGPRVSGPGDHHRHRPADQSGAGPAPGSAVRQPGQGTGLHGRQPGAQADARQRGGAAVRARVRQHAAARVQHPLRSRGPPASSCARRGRRS